MAICLLLAASLASCGIGSDLTVPPETTPPTTSGGAPLTTPLVTTPPVTTPPVTTPPVTTPPVTTPPVTTAPENPALGQINNGVLGSVASENMSVPVNMKLLGTTEAKEENNALSVKATVVLYGLDGDVVNWTTENDLIYVITRGNNRLVVIDTESMAPVCNVPLAGIPAEMNLIGDRIYVSMPELCKIDVFSKSDCTKQSSLYFDHEIASFCFDGDYIYYTEFDQHCKAFRKNLKTGETVQIKATSLFTFYEPKIAINSEDRILYIGESASSGSTLYYFDADTLALKSTFKKNNYGITNHSREIFRVGDEIFWAGYRISDTNAKELIGKYGTASYGSVTFVSDELVSTYEGLFLTDTYECLINYFDADFYYEHILVSDSYHVFFRPRSVNQNVIIGINFALEEQLSGK